MFSDNCLSLILILSEHKKWRFSLWTIWNYGKAFIMIATMKNISKHCNNEQSLSNDSDYVNSLKSLRLWLSICNDCDNEKGFDLIMTVDKYSASSVSRLPSGHRRQWRATTSCPLWFLAVYLPLLKLPLSVLPSSGKLFAAFRYLSCSFT